MHLDNHHWVVVPPASLWLPAVRVRKDQPVVFRAQVEAYGTKQQVTKDELRSPLFSQRTVARLLGKGTSGR